MAAKKSIVKPGTKSNFTRFLMLNPDRPDAPATLAVNFRTTNGARLTIIGLLQEISIFTEQEIRVIMAMRGRL